MIVSHAHKFVFVAIPKTATHSIRRALRRHLSSRDWEQCNLFEKKRFPMQAVARLGHGHISCQQLRDILPEPFFGDYYKFCFVRDPYQRFISLCYFLNRSNQRMQKDPINTMKKMITAPKFSKSILARPQSEFICDETGQRLVDFVGRVEQLQHDYNTVSQTLHLTTDVLDTVNQSQPDTYTRVQPEQLDNELRHLIQEQYRADMEWRYETTDME